MKNLGFKIKKRSPSDTPREAASQVTTKTPSTPAPAPAPTPMPPPPKDSQPGSAIVLGAFSAVTEPTYYDSGDEFDYKGKSDGQCMQVTLSIPFLRTRQPLAPTPL